MLTRIASAVVAVLLIIAAVYFFKGAGLFVLCTIVVFGCIYEYSKLTLKQAKAQPSYIASFWILAGLTYLLTAFGLHRDGSEPVLLSALFALSVVAAAAVLFLAMGVVEIRRTSDLEHAFKVQSAALLGLFYVGVFPGFAVSLIGLPSGLVHFFGLLGIVFAGDTFAYFFGRFFGKNKLLEAVSPKKTIEGSIGGLLGSAIVGFLLARFYLTAIPTLQLVTIAILSGAFAQIGDLFESLIKRLANVKDSGRIMPGHGGFLDRLDGVLFAAPIYYLLLQILA